MSISERSVLLRGLKVFTGSTMAAEKKILVSYLPEELTHNDFKLILLERTPGLTACNVVHNEGKTANRGYGSATYMTNEFALNATAVLDGMPFGRK